MLFLTGHGQQRRYLDSVEVFVLGVLAFVLVLVFNKTGTMTLSVALSLMVVLCSY